MQFQRVCGMPGFVRARMSDCGVTPCREAMRAISVVAPATLICWPTMARMAISNGSHVPGTRMPGYFAHERTERFVAREVLLDGGDVGVDVEHRSHARRFGGSLTMTAFARRRA